MVSKRIPIVRNRPELRRDECDALGVEKNCGDVQSALVCTYGKIVMLINKTAKRSEIMRSLRMLKEDIALDDFLDLKQDDREKRLNMRKIGEKGRIL